MKYKEYAQERLDQLHSRIASAAHQAGRNPKEISLVGAAKQQSTELTQAFVDQGLLHIGENYLNEALEKQQAMQASRVDWHYIGRIQSNKTAALATHFSWIHGVDRLKIARRLAVQNPPEHELNVLIQIDIDNEPSKGGVAVDQVPSLCQQVAELDGIVLRGFMVLPKPRQGLAEQRVPFAETRELLERCNQQFGLTMDSLSMGMSGDLEAAVLEGTTMVRVGTDLFGARRN